MKASEIGLHSDAQDEISRDCCFWCGCNLVENDRYARSVPRYAIDSGRRVLVEVEHWACDLCAEHIEPLSDDDRAELQNRLDEMTPPRVGRCSACESTGELFPHFDQDECEEYLLCEKCFFAVP